MIKNLYWNTAAKGFSLLNGVLSVVMLTLGLIVVLFAIEKWIELWKHPRFRQTNLMKRTV